MARRGNGDRQRYVEWFRRSAPYVHAHRGKTFVVVFSGEAVASPGFTHLVQDVALMHSLGAKLVLVHGAGPQIEERLREDGAEMSMVGGMQITDANALACVKEAVGAVRVEIEARLSMGLAGTPMAGARIRVASGNFVTARPIGILDGVDYLHTGLVRNVDADGMRQRLDSGAMVLLSPLGYSVTGEAFNLRPDDVAAAAAISLGADKLVALVEGPGVVDRKRLVRELTPPDAEALLEKGHLAEDVQKHLVEAVRACTHGVRRAHLIDRSLDGGLLLELFTRDGVGTLVTAEAYEGIRTATLADVGGILALIGPLEDKGVLVRREREKLEMEVDRFAVLERDRHLVGCAALYPWPAQRIGELACLAVAPEYQEQGRGEELLTWIERRAREQGLRRLFVLTTQTEHWFLERGFEPGRIADLPIDRQNLYNVKRSSKVFIKEL